MKFFLLIVCISYFSENIFSQKNIELIINNPDSNSINFTKKKVFFPDSLSAIKYINNLKKNQQDEGYNSFSIDSIFFDSTHVKLSFFQGQKYKWDKLYTDSAEQYFLKKNGINLSRFKNKALEITSLSNIMNRIVKAYETNGHPFIRINLDSTYFKNNQISSFINIEKNNIYSIDSIRVNGGIKLSSSILYNLIDIHPNDIYNELKIQQIDRKLKNIPYLNLKKAVEVLYAENDAKIILEIEKQKANQFNGIIGFIPNKDIETKLLLTGDLKLLLFNQLGFGEKLDFNWQKIDQFSQKVDANVNIPYFFNFPVGFDGYLNLNKKDTSYLNISSNSALLFHMSSHSSINIFYQNKSSTVLSENIQNISNISTNIFGFGLNFQNLDYIFNPSQGTDINIKIGIGNKNTGTELSPEQNKTQVENVSEIQFYKTISGNLVLKLRNQSAFLKLYNETNYDFYENEAFRIGGLKTLRGFDEEAILSTSYSIFTAEIRYLFEENSAIYLFSDGGYTEQNLTSGFISDTPIGIGAGIDFETKAGIFTLNYAIGKQMGNPFSVRSAKIHLGFISRF